MRSLSLQAQLYFTVFTVLHWVVVGWVGDWLLRGRTWSDARLCVVKSGHVTEARRVSGRCRCSCQLSWTK
jgi:hypothetical protein